LLILWAPVWLRFSRFQPEARAALGALVVGVQSPSASLERGRAGPTRLRSSDQAGGEGGIGQAAAAAASSPQGGISVFRHVLAAEATRSTGPPLPHRCGQGGRDPWTEGSVLVTGRRGVDKSSLRKLASTLRFGANRRLGRLRCDGGRRRTNGAPWARGRLARFSRPESTERGGPAQAAGCGGPDPAGGVRVQRTKAGKGGKNR